MNFRWRGRDRWLWGTMATWFIQMHIARELRAAAPSRGMTRDDAIVAMQNRIIFHFDKAWPDKI